jgi:L-alanine-DL-glutamate epimerase-like enolase superfamily enzyme
MSGRKLLSSELSRRAVMAGVAGAGALLAATAKSATTSKNAVEGAPQVKITAIESFDIQLPRTSGNKAFLPTYRGMTAGRNNVVKISTDAGVAGYSFLGATLHEASAAAAFLVGKNLFAVEAYLDGGLLNWPSVEEAMWDAIGRIAGQPLSRLLGGASLETMPVYLTYVWPVPEDQVPAKAQADQASLVRQAGFKAMKIQMMRTNYQHDVEAAAQMLAAGGPGFHVMVDRTAGAKGLWTYEQALLAAKALAAAGVYWLEEPLARDDYDGPARLRRDVPDLIITGGEGWRGLQAFRKGLEHGTYGIMQPELRTCAGPLTMRKIGALCEAWDIPIAPHAATGLALAGRLQVSAAMGSVIQEIGVLEPGAFPWDVWDAYRPIFHGETPFTFKEGAVLVPQYPGLGLNVDEKALQKYRVAGFERRGAPGISPS